MWCATVFESKMTKREVIQEVNRKTAHLRYFLMGTCKKTSCRGEEGLHYHLFYHFYQPSQRKYFSAKMLSTSWVKILQKKNPTHSIQDAARAYIKYIKAKDDVIEKGILMEQLAHDPKKHKDGELLSQEIARRIRSGTRLGKLMEEYLQMIAKIKQMGCLRPPRAHQTRVLHLYGDPGIGKSYYIQTAFQVLAVDYPRCDNYFKIGGFSKFWEGYDN
jgi:predicted ATPase